MLGMLGKPLSQILGCPWGCGTQQGWRILRAGPVQPTGQELSITIPPKCHFLRADEGTEAVLGVQEEILRGTAGSWAPGGCCAPPAHPRLPLPATAEGHCPRHFNCSANYALSWTFKVIWEEKKRKKKGKQRGYRCAKGEPGGAGIQQERGAVPPMPNFCRHVVSF